MKTSYMLALATAVVMGFTSEAQSYEYLDINNVKARFNSGGSLFWNLASAGEFEVPKGSGLKTILAGNIWIAGKSGGQLHLAAQTYGPPYGTDFFQGPMMSSGNYSSTQDALWNKVWKINKSTIDSFKSGLFSSVPLSIANWPGNGNITLGQASILAPFVDTNKDGVYTPADGDYPEIKGDQAVFFMFNDDRNNHTETGGTKLGIEIHAMAYAFEEEKLSETIFINYKIINRSTNTYDSTYIGNWTDLDIGNWTDDFIGSDVKHNAYYGYNGYAIDTGTDGYGTTPPAQAVVFLKGPLADVNDGKDNNRNGTTDEKGETISLSKFVYYNNDGSVTGNPQTPSDYYNYLKGAWKDSSSVTYGGNGYAGTINCDFIFPGNSDPDGFGTDGIIQTPWSEESTGNSPGDRKGLGASGPFTFLAGQEIEVEYAYVYSRASSGNNLASVTTMQDQIDYVQSYYDDYTSTGITVKSTPEPSISIYPNPANDRLYFSLPTKTNTIIYEIQDVMGRILESGKINVSEQNLISTSNLVAGAYVLQIHEGGNTYSNKFIKK